MNVLMISSNTLPAAPSGPAYIAGAVRQAGHNVRVFERLFANNLASKLAAVLLEFQPDVIGLSIRLVFGDELDAEAPFGTRHTDLRPRVREIVTIIREHSHAFIVLGGPGFNYYASDWLAYLDLDYGIRGEGEEAFPLFLERYEMGGNLFDIPGCVFRKDGHFGCMPPRLVENLNGAPCRHTTSLTWRNMMLAAYPRLSLPSADALLTAASAPTASWKANATA